MNIEIQMQFNQTDNGWIGKLKTQGSFASNLDGQSVNGKTKDEVKRLVQAYALRIIAACIVGSELVESNLTIKFIP